MSTTASGSLEWLSPTRVWRLTECPASVGPVLSTPVTSSISSPNAGNTAHRAVQLWIDSRGYRDADPRSRLAEAIEVALAELNGALPAAWTRTRARLISRSRELADLLAIGDDVCCEKELQDLPRALRGTPDIVVLGTNKAVVVDLKTQTLREESLAPWVVFQMTVYAHLVEHVYGLFPNQVEVFSLNRGRLPVVVTPETVTTALATVADARAADTSIAHPALDACRYCRRRLDCDPHWNAALSWPRADCLDGTIERIERAANATVAILVRGESDCHWVSGIPSELMAACGGARVRLVRLYRSETDGGASSYRWSSQSAMTF